MSEEAQNKRFGLPKNASPLQRSEYLVKNGMTPEIQQDSKQMIKELIEEGMVVGLTPSQKKHYLNLANS